MPEPKTPARRSEEDLRSKEEILAHVGGRIRELRDLQGLTLAALGEFVGIDLHRLSRIERGMVNISVETADRIARGLGVYTWELFVPRDRSEVLRIEPRSERRSKLGTRKP